MVNIQLIHDQWANEKPVYNILGNIVVDFLKIGLSRYEILPEITYRIKDILSIIKKIKQKQHDKPYSYESLTDKLGIRVICPFLNDIDNVDKFILKNFQIHNVEKKKDKLDFNKLDYQSNHYDVSIMCSLSEFSKYIQYESMIFEIQVRTLNQHAWASASHALLYKQDIKTTDEMKRKIYRLLSLYEIADEEFTLVNKYLQNQADSFLYAILRRLEGKIYKYAKIDFDREMSVENLKRLFNLFNANEQNLINSDIENFIAENNEKIECIFSGYKSRFHEIPFLTQPEIFIIWFGLERFQFTITDNWDQYFDNFELEQIKSIWGCKI